jgi:hypothetical protein
VSTSRKALLEPLRVRVRRFQLIVGLGFLALVLGSMLSVALTLRLSVRVQALPFDFLRLLIAVALENLWVLGVLPVLCYGAARILELRPLPTALGAALSGQAFLFALEFVRDGVDGLLGHGWLATLLELGAFAAGVVLSHRTVLRAREAVRLGQERALQQAAARKQEYAEFLRQAEQAGERAAQREAERAGAAPDAPPREAAPAGATDSPGPGPGEPKAAPGATDSPGPGPGEPKAPAA